VDIDPVTSNIDPKAVEKAITNDTVAILPVHCYGIPCDVDALQDIANKHNLKLVYDAAHAFGVRYKDQSLLNYGDLSTVSFHATKVFNTFEGGAIICHSAEMKQRIDQLKNFGIIDETTVNDVSLNGKLSEVHAALGLLQLKSIDQVLESRMQVDRYYRKLLADIEGIHCIQRDDLDKDNYAYFPIIISDSYPLTRDQLFEKLKQQNIFSRKYFYPLMTDLNIYKQYKSDTPNAKLLSEQVLCLPMYPALEDDVIEKIVNIIKG
jgi:dTDP-4-amino-4,6-dideoxygalactose transaminase